MFDYRWTWRTIWPNLYGAGYDIYYGIWNIFKWLPIVWRDRDWDWAYLFEAMEFKLRNMSALFKKYGHHVGSEKDAKRMLICAELLKRLREEDYIFDKDFGKEREAFFKEYLFRLLKKHYDSWWS